MTTRTRVLRHRDCRDATIVFLTAGAVLDLFVSAFEVWTHSVENASSNAAEAGPQIRAYRLRERVRDKYIHTACVRVRSSCRIGISSYNLWWPWPFESDRS